MPHHPLANQTGYQDLSSAPLIQVKALGYQIETAEQPLVILADLNMTISAGESVAIVGPSGAGKSTLLALLAGLDVPTQGTLMWQGAPFSQLDEDDRAAIRARDVGFVFQSFQLLPELTALENVLLPLELQGAPEAESKAQHWLNQVGLESRLHHHPQVLSGGEQQRVAIARAFATTPKVLFADEPTGNLDSDNGQHVADLLFQLNQESGATLILVTHDLTLAQRCQRILWLRHGRLEEAHA